MLQTESVKVLFIAGFGPVLRGATAVNSRNSGPTGLTCSSAAGCPRLQSLKKRSRRPALFPKLEYPATQVKIAPPFPGKLNRAL